MHYKRIYFFFIVSLWLNYNNCQKDNPHAEIKIKGSASTKVFYLTSLLENILSFLIHSDIYKSQYSYEYYALTLRNFLNANSNTLISAVNSIYKALNKNESKGAIFIRLSKTAAGLRYLREFIYKNKKLGNDSEIFIDLLSNKQTKITTLIGDFSEEFIAFLKSTRPEFINSDRYMSIAIYTNSFSVLKFLVELFPQDIIKTNEAGENALMESLKYGNPQIISLMFQSLSKNNISININDLKDNKGITPLMNACISPNFYVLNMLILSGVDVNAQDEDGDTALAIVLRNIPNALTLKNNSLAQDYLEIAKYLLRAGACPNIKDKYNSESFKGVSLLNELIEGYSFEIISDDDVKELAFIKMFTKELESLLRSYCPYLSENMEEKLDKWQVDEKNYKKLLIKIYNQNIQKAN